jgi:heptosyltransferase-2
MPGPSPDTVPTAGARPSSATEGTLVIQTAFLGDTVLTLPLLMTLAATRGPVDVLTTPGALPMVAGHPAVRRAILFDKHGRDHGLHGLLGVARTLRRLRHTTVYLPHGSIRSALIARLAGIPRRIGFSGAPGAFLYTEARATSGGPMSSRLAALAGSASAPLPAPPWLALSADDRARADEWLRERQVPPGFLALAPGARWDTKRWPFYSELAAAVREPIVVLGGGDDTALGEAVIARAPGRSWNAAGALPLMVSAALLARAALLVTNDSAPLHLATSLGVPVVALFGPTVPAFGFGPVWPGDRVVEHPRLGCRPCHHHGPVTCPLGHHRCMRELDVAEVVAAVTAAGGRR